MIKCFLKIITLFLLSVAIYCVIGVYQNSIVNAMQEAEARIWHGFLDNSLSGDWYDQKGNVVLSVKDGYINGCEVVDAYNYEKADGIFSLTFRIIENQGTRDMKIEMMGTGLYSEDYHHFIVIDDKNTLHRVSEVKYNESINGIYLGMSEENFLKNHKNFIKKTNNNRVKGNTWYSAKEGLEVYFWGNEIDSITILPDSISKFDKSGLGANDSADLYYQKYGGKRCLLDNNDIHLNIGHGEYIVRFKGLNGISLGFFGS